MKQTLVYWVITSLAWLYAKLFFRLEVLFEKGETEFFSAINGPLIIAPNHVSYIDPLLIASLWPKPLYFFAGDHLFQKSKWFAWLLKQLHSYPVNRSHGVSAVKEAVRLVMQEKLSIVIFPEGTRSQDGVLQTMQDGVAFISLKSGASIVPISISGTYEAWPKQQRYPKLFGKIIVRVGAPINPNQLEIEKTATSKEKIAYVNQLLHDSLKKLKAIESS